ncbi:hypothetical protein ACFOYW_00475 [Gryllotalpicola reticulitermitis]|uniref:Bacterial Pleckstrin homology domain-containing protein n=1 Tax=Gryllotalpicola reticulitermitis TaxID=1184153 RepID=A0ABV8Q0D8_9MICO
MHTFGGALIGLGVALGVLGLIWWFVISARRARSEAPGIADVAIRDGVLVVTPRGAWKVLALAGHIEIPLRNIVGCHPDPDPCSSHPVSLRVGGTGVLGRIRAGYMRGSGERSWWLYRYGDHAVVIDVADNPLSYLVIEVDDPDATTEMVRRAAATVA